MVVSGGFREEWRPPRRHLRLSAVTFKKSVRLNDYFSNTDKFIRFVGVLKRLVGLDFLDEKKRFHLKKHVTILRKAKEGKTAKKD